MPYQNPYPLMGNQMGTFHPSGYMTAGNTQYQPQGYMTAGSVQGGQQVHGFVYVTGIDGAKAFQMPPNSEMPLFDSTSGDIMFIKTTDGAGFPTIKVCHVTEEQDVQRGDAPDYATRAELNSVYERLSGQLESLKGDLYGPVSKAPDSQK